MKNTWGLYPWFTEWGNELIHPQDYEKFKELHPYGKVFHCIEQADEYIVLEYNKETYRVKADLYKIIVEPVFKFGDKVQDVKNLGRIGTIDEIHWHHLKECPMYFIMNNKGQRISKRYFQSDLSKLK